MKRSFLVVMSLSCWTFACAPQPLEEPPGGNAGSSGSGASAGAGGAAGEAGGAGTGGAAGAAGGAGAAGAAGSVGEPGPKLPPGWTLATHPCIGYRTDALHYDADAMTAWVGCGTTTSGFGLYRSTDGGVSWEAPETEPAGALAAFRVNDISRSSDGKLYLAGTNNGAVSVYAVDTSATPYALTVVLEYGKTVDTGFTVGSFRRAANGSALAESLNGHQMLYRPDDSVGKNPQAWVNAYYWASGGTQSFQILDLEEKDGKFYGCGSTIADTPKVYLPSPSGDPWKMKVLELGSFPGEMWNVDVDASGRVVVGGVDQGAARGMVFVSSIDPHDPNGWTAYDVGTIAPTSPTWIRGVCTNGQRIAAVGEYSMTSDPLLIVSDDGGKTFVDQTPSAPAALSECIVFPNGSLAVAGGEGFIGVHVPE